MVKKLLGVADIAAMCDVEPKTVSIWRLRYADFPEPDVTVGETAGWDPSRAEEIRTWMSRRPGRGRKTPPAPHVQEALRRIFVYDFMRPDDFAWAPIDFPGIQYDDDGVLADGMQAKATAHLIDAIRQQGYELVFDDPATDPRQLCTTSCGTSGLKTRSASTSSSDGCLTNAARSTTAAPHSMPPTTPSNAWQLWAAKFRSVHEP